MIPTLWDDGVEAIDVAPVYWGTSTILTIFFSACLVSALFFALGYSFGGGGTAPADAGQTAYLPRTSTLPVAGSAISKRQRKQTSVRSQPSRSAVIASVPRVLEPAIAQGNVRPTTPPAVRNVSVLAPAGSAAGIRKSIPPVAADANPTAGAGQVRIMVQIAAVRDRRNAQTLAAQLQKRGFNARVYAGRHDPYLHVQIGPFFSTSQAQRMQRRVRSSGYRAVLK